MKLLHVRMGLLTLAVVGVFFRIGWGARAAIDRRPVQVILQDAGPVTEPTFPMPERCRPTAAAIDLSTVEPGTFLCFTRSCDERVRKQRDGGWEFER